MKKFFPTKIWYEFFPNVANRLAKAIKMSAQLQKISLYKNSSTRHKKLHLATFNVFYHVLLFLHFVTLEILSHVVKVMQRYKDKIENLCLEYYILRHVCKVATFIVAYFYVM